MIVIAAVAMFDSRASALPDPTGTYPGGLGPGFYPFWSAAMIAGAALFVIFRSRVLAGEAQGVFAKRESCRFCDLDGRCDGVAERWLQQGLIGPLVPLR